MPWAVDLNDLKKIITETNYKHQHKLSFMEQAFILSVKQNPPERWADVTNRIMLYGSTYWAHSRIQPTPARMGQKKSKRIFLIYVDIFQ